jgi:hypothetical protein
MANAFAAPRALYRKSAGRAGVGHGGLPVHVRLELQTSRRDYAPNRRNRNVIQSNSRGMRSRVAAPDLPPCRDYRHAMETFRWQA